MNGLKNVGPRRVPEPIPEPIPMDVNDNNDAAEDFWNNDMEPQAVDFQDNLDDDVNDAAEFWSDD